MAAMAAFMRRLRGVGTLGGSRSSASGLFAKKALISSMEPRTVSTSLGPTPTPKSASATTSIVTRLISACRSMASPSRQRATLCAVTSTMRSP